MKLCNILWIIVLTLCYTFEGNHARRTLGNLTNSGVSKAEPVTHMKVDANGTPKETIVPTEKNVVGVAYQAHESNAEEEEDTALFGDSAEQGQFPFLAAIFRSTEGPFVCVGSIISKNIVLTSTICLGNSPGDLYPDQYSVLAGVVDLMEEVSSQWRYVVQVIKSPAILNDSESDVVILVLNAPFRINWKVKPIPLSLEPFRGRRICQVIGWGPSNYDDGDEDPQEEVQKVVSVVAVDKYTCQHVFPKAGPELDKCLCIEPLDETNTACIADDGSAVICDEELVGLVRHEGGNVCANDTYPGMYTDLGMLGSWTSLHVPPDKISTSEFGKHSTAADPTYHLVLHTVLSFIFQTIVVVFIIK